MDKIRLGLGLITLERAIEELIAAKEMANRRPAYVRTLRSYLTMFARGWEGTPIAEVEHRHVAEWFKGRRGEAPSTRQTGMMLLSALFEFSIRRGYRETNPISKMERVSVDRSPPRIMTPAQCRAMLNYTRRDMPWRLPQVILGLYAGIRPAELTRLRWENINIDRGYVTIDAAAAKTRQRRIVHLDPKAIAWLRRCTRSRRNEMIGTTSWKWKRRVAKHCDIQWGPDLLRHTAASYLLAKHGDAGKVARMLGNSADVLLKHYIELVSPEDCRRFWKCSFRQIAP